MTREIQLTQGKVALVDDEDYDFLNAFKWYGVSGKNKKTSYARRNIGQHPHQRAVWMHREIAARMGLNIAGLNIDHINGDGLDNRRRNLRAATTSENARNQTAHRDNTSGFKGVFFNKQYEKWQAKISTGGKQISLGFFNSPEDAAHTYDAAARKYHGEFAKTNFPTP